MNHNILFVEDGKRLSPKMKLIKGGRPKGQEYKMKLKNINIKK